MNTTPQSYEEALRLVEQGDTHQALTLLLKVVSDQPAEHQSRLLLARVFHRLSMTSLAVRELQHLVREVPSLPILKKLLEALSPGASSTMPPSESSSTVAEADFDIDLLDNDSAK